MTMTSQKSDPDDPTAGARAVVDATDADAGDGDGRPYVLMISHVLMGHLAPMLRIAAALRARWGWRVFFLGPTSQRARIEASGATFLPLMGEADLDGRLYYESPPVDGYAELPWHERLLIDLERQCFDTIPAQWESLTDALRALRQRDSDRRVLVLAEAFFHGVLPLRYGAPLPADLALPSSGKAGPERPRSICVSVTIPAIRSRDLPPLGYPFPFDTSPEGRARNARLWERSWERRTARLAALLGERLREAGTPGDRPLPPDQRALFAGANYLCHERVLQLGVPGFEYPRTDWPDGFRFAGLVQGPPSAVNVAGGNRAAPPQEKDPEFPWWPELVANSALARDDPRRKKVIVVTQGTVEINPEDLILPTIQAFAPSTTTTNATLDPARLLVVAILGWKDSRLPAALASPPANVRVADYLTYDAALAHADVWVSNGGFGAVCHALAHGVPQVVAGEGMDKGENAARVARSGCGVDLRTGRPTADAIARAVAEVLAEEDGPGSAPDSETYRNRFVESAARLKRECESLDVFQIVHEELCQLARDEGGDTEE